ncbi:thermostable hemolysin [Actinokineospora sp. NPDC004072]
MTSTARRFRIGFAHQGTLPYEYCVELTGCDHQPGLFVTAWDNTRHSPTFGRTVGVVGLTGAEEEPLPSEAALGMPVEQACTRLAGWAVRRRVAEVSPLVSLQRGADVFLMRNLPTIALRQGYDFLLATLTTEQVVRSRIAGWDFHAIAGQTGVLPCGTAEAFPIAS